MNGADDVTFHSSTNEASDDVNDQCGSHGGHVACVPLIRAAAPAAASGSFQGETVEGLECGSRSSGGSRSRTTDKFDTPTVYGGARPSHFFTPSRSHVDPSTCPPLATLTVTVVYE